MQLCLTLKRNWLQKNDWFDWKVQQLREQWIDLRAEDLRAEVLKAESLKAEGLKAEGLEAESLRAESLRAEDQLRWGWRMLSVIVLSDWE